MADLTFPWERSAMDGDEMPDGMPLEEQQAWQAVAHLYGRYRLKLIDRKTGHSEIGKIAAALDLRRREANADRRLCKWHADLMKAAEGAANAYARNRTLENADRLYQVIYGMLPKGANPHG